jgi:TRAP-type transport system periplasmic protein
MRVSLPLLGVILLSGIGSAQADPIRLRMAALAPEGTAWAREMHALARDIEAETHGQVELKWYLGGIAGDELTVIDRIRRGQLDGTAGALFCERLAPSFRVGRIVGLIKTRDESMAVVAHLRNQLDREFTRSGFVALGIATFGNMMLLTRHPVRSLADLKRQHLWVYDLDELLLKMMSAMGVATVALPVPDALKAYDEGRVDGFITSPTVALAFQWSSRVRYYTDLTVSILPGCMVVAQRAFDALPIEHQRAVRSASAKFVARFEAVGRMQEQQLLGGLFDRQGVRRVEVDPAARVDFFEAASIARAHIEPTLVDPSLLNRVLSFLADYRAMRDSERSSVKRPHL